jgi:PEP-CTERM motif
MRISMCVLIWAGLVCESLSAATIQYQVQVLDAAENEFRITYSPYGVVFLLNQELDIQFDPGIYLSLSSGMGPVGFNVLLLQPNNPPGTSGDFSALALVDSPALSSAFSVDVTMTGSGWPGVQRFAINQLDGQGLIVSSIVSGDTTIAGAVPEPATFLLAAVALLVVSVLFAVRRRFTRSA